MNYLVNLNLNKNEIQNAVIQPLASAPAGAKAGQIYYNSGDKLIYRYDGTGWGPVGVVYSQGSSAGAVITGLDSGGNVTTTNVTGLTLTGYTPVTGGYISNNMTLEQALAALDTAVKNAVSGGGEVNQNAWSNITVKKQSTGETAVTGAAADTTIAAGAKTDTFAVASGNKWIGVGSDGKQINVGHSLSGVSAGTFGSGAKVPVVTVDKAGHVTSVSEQAISEPDVPEYTVAKLETATAGYLASYQLQKDGTGVGAVINVPKDYLVKSASVKTSTGASDPSGLPSGTKYIDFVVNTYDTSSGSGTESHIYLNVQDLVDVYTPGNGIDISDSNVISAKVVAGNGLSVGTNGIAMAAASESANGAMTSAMVQKLNGITAGATENYFMFNGKMTTSPTFYAPTTYGLVGYELVGNGATTAPLWKKPLVLSTVASNPALTASNGAFAWSVNPGSDYSVFMAQVYKGTELVLCDISCDRASNEVEVSIDDTEGVGTLAEGTYTVHVLSVRK